MEPAASASSSVPRPGSGSGSRTPLVSRGNRRSRQRVRTAACRSRGTGSTGPLVGLARLPSSPSYSRYRRAVVAPARGTRCPVPPAAGSTGALIQCEEVQLLRVSSQRVARVTRLHRLPGSAGLWPAGVGAGVPAGADNLATTPSFLPARTPALPGTSRGTQGASHFIIAPDSTGGLTFKTVSTIVKKIHIIIRLVFVWTLRVIGRSGF